MTPEELQQAREAYRQYADTQMPQFKQMMEELRRMNVPFRLVRLVFNKQKPDPRQE